jgi:RimJ/RimL family protein N-acetyltransferase
MNEREFLHLHIEAVWEIDLPPLEHPIVELPVGGPLPAWNLYLGSIGSEQFAIWRPDVMTIERDALLALARAALDVFGAATPLRREVVLRQTLTAHMSLAQAQSRARLLAEADRDLVEAFEPSGAPGYLDEGRAPCVGVVVNGRLVSVAHSSRRTPVACELGIDTLPEARRRGYALAATLVWAEAVRQMGLLPIYSALASNVASLRLAASAGFATVARGVYDRAAPGGE